MLKKYLFERRKVGTIKKHPILQQFKTELHDYFVEATKVMGAANIPIISEDGILISNPFDFDAQKKNQEEEMLVRVEPDLTPENFFQALAHTLSYTHLCHEDKVLLITEATKELQKNTQWAESLGDGDINVKLGKILGCHKETIKYAKRQDKLVKDTGDEEKGKRTTPTHAFKFSPGVKAFTFLNKKFQLVGEPTKQDKSIVYSFLSDEAQEIDIVIKGLDLSGIVEKKQKPAIELKVNLNPGEVMTSELLNHKRLIDNLLSVLISFDGVKKIAPSLTQKGDVKITTIRFTWERLLIHYIITDNNGRVSLPRVKTFRNSKGALKEARFVNQAQIGRFAELTKLLHPIINEERARRRQEAQNVFLQKEQERGIQSEAGTKEMVHADGSPIKVNEIADGNNEDIFA